MIEKAILLSTYNGEKYVSKQLDSIFRQIDKEFVLYVRDDGSTDRTLEILESYVKRYNNMFLFKDNVRRGASGSFLWLLSNVDAKYYMFCDQDDVWLDNKILLQYGVMESSCDRASIPLVVFHDLILTDVEGNVIADSFWRMHNMNIVDSKFETLFIKNVVTGCSCMINREMKLELLKFNTKNIVMYDHVIALIAYSFGKAVYINQGLILYRDHSSSVTPKLNVSFFFRMRNFYNNLFIPNYLLDHLLQIEEFIRVYNEYLSDRKLRVAKSFLSLKRRGFIVRFISQKLNNY